MDDNFYVDPTTLQVRFKKPKKVATSEKSSPYKRLTKRSGDFKFNHPVYSKKKKEMATEPILKRLTTKANRLKPPTKKNIPAYLEAMGLKSGEPVYKEIISIALNKDLPLEDRKDFLKFVGDRTIAKRQQKMISVAGIPKIKTLEDIMVASEIIHKRVVDGELTPDEGETMFRIYDNLRNILATQQLKIMMEDAQKMKENVVKTLSEGLLIEEVINRLSLMENKDQKFQSWFKDCLSVKALIDLLKIKMNIPAERNKIFAALKELLK